MSDDGGIQPVRAERRSKSRGKSRGQAEADAQSEGGSKSPRKSRRSRMGGCGGRSRRPDRVRGTKTKDYKYDRVRAYGEGGHTD